MEFLKSKNSFHLCSYSLDKSLVKKFREKSRLISIIFSKPFFKHLKIFQKLRSFGVRTFLLMAKGARNWEDLPSSKKKRFALSALPFSTFLQMSITRMCGSDNQKSPFRVFEATLFLTKTSLYSISDWDFIGGTNQKDGIFGLKGHNFSAKGTQNGNIWPKLHIFGASDAKVLKNLGD